MLDSLDVPDPVPTQELSVLDRIVRGRMVGRKKEMDEAINLWRNAVGVQGQTLLISGEPGIGKTRFVRELMTHAEVSGGQVLVGACFAEGGAPYAPFGQIARKVLGGLSSPNGPVPDYILADLITLAPDIQPLFPDVSPNPKLDPKFEQQRLFESVTSFFSQLGEESPFLIVVEDVHWADSGTLFLLRHLARNLSSIPLMLCATYREIELDEQRPFQEVLLDLNRERLAVRMKLHRLNQEQCRSLLATIFAEEIRFDFLEGVYNETEGNPFFIEELLKSLIESGAVYFEGGRWHRPEDIKDLEIPQSIRVVIQSRVNKLPGRHQNVLRLASIIGHEFSYRVLAAASGQDEDEIIDALEAAEQGQLIKDISERVAVKYTFVHALIPSTMSDGLNVLRCQRKHNKIAASIERLQPDDFEALAHHFTAAGELDKAITYYERAAERVVSVMSSGVN